MLCRRVVEEGAFLLVAFYVGRGRALWAWDGGRSPTIRLRRRQGNERADAGRSGRGRSVDARLAPRRHPVASRREVRAQDELALESTRLETAVCVGDLIEGDRRRGRIAGVATGRRAAPGPPGIRRDGAAFSSPRCDWARLARGGLAGTWASVLIITVARTLGGYHGWR
jgi:hypothetical protein